MAIIEVGILFEGTLLIEVEYYTSNYVFDKGIRHNLLQGLDGVLKETFGDDIQSFSIGNYAIIVVRRLIGEIDNENKKAALMMYTIVDKGTEEKVVKQAMETALDHFLNRYSMVDIWNKNIKKFSKDFPDRMKKIFRDLILKSEDRFKSLF
jgi:hypothetical protein